jgi:small subunit ribosomal protein S1
VADRYKVNSRVVGQVVNVTDYGAFVELESGVEGLIHITEMTWSRRMKHPFKTRGVRQRK